MVDKKHIGKQGEPTKVRIKAASVSDFAQGVGEMGPVYHDHRLLDGVDERGHVL